MLKRTFDIAAAAAGLVALAPVLAAAVVAIKLTDRGPVFYGHPRIGHGGTPFRCLKLRSMVVDGDVVLARHLAADPAARSEWESSRKLRDDPRVTAVGRFLRKTSLDEIPQLLNIFRGEMSVVGPRPVTAAELDRYGSDAQKYVAARPGLTGLWQVSGRNDVSYERRVEYDRTYVESWSMLRDIAIMARTVPVIVRGRGCY